MRKVVELRVCAQLGLFEPFSSRHARGGRRAMSHLFLEIADVRMLFIDFGFGGPFPGPGTIKNGGGPFFLSADFSRFEVF